MSKYAHDPLDLSGLHTIPIAARGGKVTVEHFAKPYVNTNRTATVRESVPCLTAFLDSLPHILAADSFRAVVSALQTARTRKKMILWGLGGHVIKCGLPPVLIDLMHRGYATAFALNGAAAIHDFEIAIAGQTSEDVEAVLPDGRFGTAEETGREMNAALNSEYGFGEALGRHLEKIADPKFANASLLHEAYRHSTPVTVHVAIGTDTPHTHPTAKGDVIGRASHHDFRLLCTLVKELNDGGVYLNVGSAVLLPEVFLKAVSVVRNLENPLANFTTVNFDFLQHYRPRVNVVERPHARSGGQGYSITGHHELMIPLLAATLIERS
ncbi:MAG TPA: hypothetical protein VGP62_02010 [Bryobacteraceae bacterium]|jgi:hypothetical protein|nr:hypothetical protein [Bryobacteraceae bacterium]